MNINTKDKKKIINLIKALQPTARVILFGSHAYGTPGKFSDVDIAIDAGSALELDAFGEIRAVLEAADFPHKIDPVDIYRMPTDMRKSVLEKGSIWSD